MGRARAAQRGFLRPSAVVLRGGILALTVLCVVVTAGAEDREQGPAPAAPLGSFENPVRCEMPSGEREYLLRLRCPDGAAPEIGKRSSSGRGPYGSIVDKYEVRCAGEPVRDVFMDMYHRDHREMAAVPGFTVLPELPARVAKGCPPAVPGTPSGTYVFNSLEVAFPARLSQDALRLEPAGLSGRVLVRLVVTADGKADPASIEIVHASHEELGARALQLIDKLQFQPAEHHLECRVPQTVELPIDFPKARLASGDAET